MIVKSNVLSRLLFSGISLMLPLHLSMALDEDGDGVSDVYAAHHGLATGTGEEDPDGDGQSNREESVWGTDPYDRTSAFRPLSPSVTGGAYDFAVPTLSGKRYLFQGSLDLSEGSWINMGSPFEGDGQVEHLFTSFPIAGTNKFFWRVSSLPEIDEDGDGLGGFEEYLLGTSDLEKDSDGDTLLDLVEFIHGFDPSMNADGDGDDLPDDWERLYGLSALLASGDNGKMGDPDGDGLTNFQEFEQGRNPYEHESNPNGIPARPTNLVTTIHLDGSRTFTWDDVSDNEDYFFIMIRRADGTMVRVADQIPANTTSYTVSASEIQAALQQ